MPVRWQAPEFEAAGGKIIATGPQNWAVQLPAWKAAGNHYPLHAVAWDKKGNASRTASGEVVVDGVGIDVSRSSVVLSTGTAVADGKSKVVMTLTVRDGQGNRISGLAPAITLPLTFTPLTTAMRTGLTPGGQAWDVLTGALLSSAIAADMPVALANGGVTLSEVKETDTAGVYTAVLTAGLQAGTVRVTPHISGVVFPAKDLQLTPVSTQADTGAIHAPVNPLADGHTVPVTVPVTDENGKPLINKTITLTVDGTDVQTTTDHNGHVVIELPGQLFPGHHDFTVGVKGDTTPEKVGVDFVAVTGSAPTASPVTITGLAVVGETLTGHYVFADADGDKEDTTKTTLAWYRDGQAITGATAATNRLTAADETHTITFGVTPVSVTGSPATGNEVRSSATSVIIASTNQLAASVSAADSVFTLTPTTIDADGHATAPLSFTAKDAQQQPVSGLTVTFPTSGVAGITVSSVTETNGVYTATLSGSSAGVAHLTVNVNGTDKTQPEMHDVTLLGVNKSWYMTPPPLSVSPTNIQSGTGSAVITFAPKYVAGSLGLQPATGLSVSFSVDIRQNMGDATDFGITIGPVVEANGVYTATITSTKSNPGRGIRILATDNTSGRSAETVLTIN